MAGENKTQFIQQPKRLFWLLNSLGWFILFVINVVFQTNYLSKNFKAVSYSIVIVIVGFSITLLIRYIVLRANAKDYPIKQLVPIYILSTIIGTFLSVFSYSVINRLIFPETTFTLRDWISNLFNFGLIISIWSLIYISYLFFEKQKFLAQERLNLSLQLKEAELNNLRKQLSPHFLFNTINNIRSLILINPNKARDALLDVSSLLRYALNYQKKKSVTIEEEMEIVNGYINLNKIHLGDNVTFDIQIDDLIKEFRIPPMSIQLLVENATKHGKLLKGSIIKITAGIENNRHFITVINPGKLDQSVSDGIGLANLIFRLNSMYPNQAEFTLIEKTNQIHAKIEIR